ncbi:MAG: T9SS type A sorting domain-containing protein, partial [Chitinophagaceae bacterium]
TGNPRDVCGPYTPYPAVDTFKVRSLVKDTIDGRIYDRIRATSDSDYYNFGIPNGNGGYILSGIGSLESPYPMINVNKCRAMAGLGPITDEGRFFRLACYSDNLRGTVDVSYGTGPGCGNIIALSTAVSTVSLKEIGIRSWPNPVRGALFLDGVPARATYTLTSLDGKTIGAGILRNGALSTSRLAPGLYLLQVQWKDRRAVLKLVKQ